MNNENEKKKENYFESLDNNNIKKIAIRSGAITIFTRMLTQIIQMLCVLITARIISPEDFGLVAIATSIIGYFLIFIDLGLTDAVIQQDYINNKQINTLFWINQAFNLIIALIIIALSPLLTWIFKETQLFWILVILSSGFIISSFSMQHYSLLKRNMLFKRIAIIEIIAVTTSSVITIILALNGFRYWSLVIRTIINYSIVSVLSWIFCQWRPGFPAWDKSVLPLFKFGVNSIGTFFINNISRNLDKTLIGWKFGKEPLGFYSRAYYLADIPTNQLSTSLYHVSVSTLSKLRNDPSKYRHYYLMALAAISFIGMPLSFLMVTMSKDIIYVLLGPKWDISSNIFSILGIGTGIQLIYSTNSWLHISLGRSDRWLYWGIFSSVLLSSSFIVGLFFGVYGVAICYISIMTILTLPALHYAGKPVNLKITDIIKTVWRYLSAAALTGLINWVLFDKIHFLKNQLLRLLLSSVFFIIIYLFFIIVFFLSKKPIIDFIGILKQLLPKPSKNTAP
jgi:O-antigen/teichoic acid export membrane protein